ncbi:MAG TPA: acyltransferase family protein [Actinomycetales bacterium]|nr:acyltransferase family protein [Actinomycetales bacterium]
MAGARRPLNFRPELHGVRGIALALVVSYHLFANGRVSGGIDIFLTITGFLFTASLLRRITEGEGRLDFGRHFTRIAQRILPPAVLVAVITAIAALLLLPSTRWLQALDEARASILYHENWQLIWSQLSYEAGGVGTSPFQHFWSLSIQGQFHLIWPFVILGAVWWARRAKWSPYRVTAVVVALVFVASFAYANYLTVTQPAISYFHTATRLWQPALGGLVGLILPRIELGQTTRIICGWAGLFLIATAGLFLDGAAHFPGYQSLWPVVGLFLVLAGGYTGSRFAADRIFVWRPVTFIADISYALYLWHWPLFIFFLVLARVERVTAGQAALLLGVSIVLATLTTYGLERPLARVLKMVQRRRHILVGATGVLLLAGGSAFAGSSYLEHAQAASLDTGAIDGLSHPGAAVLAGNASGFETLALPYPPPRAIAADIPKIYGTGCTQTHRDEAGSDEVLTCEHEAENYDPGHDPTIVIVGGSKSGQWNPAFEFLADQHGWKVVTMDKGGCQFAFTADEDPEPMQSHHCQSYNDQALKIITELEPSLVVTIATTARHQHESLPDGFIRAWRALDAADIPVLAIRDTPRFEWDVADCLAQNAYDGRVCGAPRSDVMPANFVDLAAKKQIPENAALLDLTDYVCSSDYCEAVVGNIAVYRDMHHITVSYMETLAPLIEENLKDVFPELFE